MCSPNQHSCSNHPSIIGNRNQIRRKLTRVGAVCAKENSGLVRQLNHIVDDSIRDWTALNYRIHATKRLGTLRKKGRDLEQKAQVWRSRILIAAIEESGNGGRNTDGDTQ